MLGPRAAAAALLFIAPPRPVAGHGAMTKPVTRNFMFGQKVARASGNPNPNPAGYQVGGSCYDNYTAPGNCMWFIMTSVPKGVPLTIGVKDPVYSIIPEIFFPPQSGCRMPWRAPGAAPVDNPCGWYGGQPPGGKPPGQFTCGGFTPITCHNDGGGDGCGVDGRALDPVPRETRDVWQIGGTAEVGWSMTFNHGGGYSYRLCPADGDVTEACFQKTPLQWASGTSWIDDGRGSRRSFNATLIDGALVTPPVDRTWAMNPVPCSSDMPPCQGSFDAPLPGVTGSGPFNFSIVDQLSVPADLKPGDYILSMRWDCAQTAEVWVNCADITLTDQPVPATPEPVVPMPPPVPPSDAACTEAMANYCGGAGSYTVCYSCVYENVPPLQQLGCKDPLGFASNTYCKGKNGTATVS